MKAIILIIIVFFSFTNLSAQEVASAEKNSTEVQKEMITKADYYNALIKTYNFDIKFKKNTIAKSGYYNRLLIRNGFRLKTRKSTRLVMNGIQKIVEQSTKV